MIFPSTQMLFLNSSFNALKKIIQLDIFGTDIQLKLN